MFILLITDLHFIRTYDFFQLVGFIFSCVTIYMYSEEDESCKYITTTSTYVRPHVVMSEAKYKPVQSRESWCQPTYVSFTDSLEMPHPRKHIFSPDTCHTNSKVWKRSHGIFFIIWWLLQQYSPYQWFGVWIFTVQVLVINEILYFLNEVIVFVSREKKSCEVVIMNSFKNGMLFGNTDYIF